MDNVLFRRGDQTFIDENVPLNDGQIIFNETDEAIYLDVTINNNVVRKRYGGGNLSRSDIDLAFSTTSENPIANKVVTNAIGSLSSLQTDVKTNLVNAINEVNTKVSKTEVLISNSGDAYSSSSAYSVGDYVIHDDKLYRCITACSAGSWATNQSCFTQDTLVNEVDRINGKLVKFYYGEWLLQNVAANSDFEFAPTLPSDLNTLIAIIPFGINPYSNWNSYGVFTLLPVNGTKIKGHILGTGTQNFKIYYWIVYI